MASKYLASLTTLDDQMANQFTFAFSSIPGTSVNGGGTSDLTIRMDRSIDIPEVKVAMYEIEYKGMKMPMIAQKEDFDKTFSLNFRLDENWAVYKGLQNWYDKAFNPGTGVRGSIGDYSVSGTLSAFAGGTVKKTITFDRLRIKSIKLESFDHGSGDPSRVECNFLYTYTTFGQS